MSLFGIRVSTPATTFFLNVVASPATSSAGRVGLIVPLPKRRRSFSLKRERHKEKQSSLFVDDYIYNNAQVASDIHKDKITLTILLLHSHPVKAGACV